MEQPNPLARPSVLADPSRRVDGLVVDALAYVDSELDAPGMRDAVNTLILEEMERYPAPDYTSEMRPAPPELPASASPAVQAELSRIAAGGAFVRADRDRGVAASLAPPSGGDAESVAAWEAAVDRARIAVEEQGVAAINLELFQRFGVDAWKGHVEELDALQAAQRRQSAALGSRVDAVNAARKSAQEPHGARLKSLVRRWEDSVAINGQIELACADAEREVKRLRTLARSHGLLPDEPAPGPQSHQSQPQAST